MRFIALVPYALLVVAFNPCNAEIAASDTSTELEEIGRADLALSIVEYPAPRNVFDHFIHEIGVKVEDVSKKVEAFMNDVVTVQLPKVSSAVATKTESAVRKLVDDVMSGKAQGPAVNAIRPVLAKINATIFIAQQVESVVDDMAKGKGVSSDRMVEELGTIFQAAVVDTARVSRYQPSNHDERERITARVLEQVGLGLVDAASAFGIPRGNAQELGVTFQALVPFVKNMVVAIGDIADQHPMEVRAMIWLVSLLIPGNLLFLRLLLGFCFGLITAEPGSFTSLGVRLIWDVILPDKEHPTNLIGEPELEDLVHGLENGDLKMDVIPELRPQL